MGWGGVTVWASKVKTTYAGFFDYDFDGGAGFGTSDYTFQSILTRKAGEMSAADRNKIDIVAVFGGVNDRSSSATNIDSGIVKFAQIVKTNFPNAVVKIFGMFTHLDKNTDIPQTLSVMQAYKDSGMYVYENRTCAPIEYITNSEYATHRYDIFQDGVHLNQSGQNRLFRYAMPGIINGSISVYDHDYQTIDGSCGIDFYQCNDMTYIRVQGTSATAIPTSSGYTVRMWEKSGIVKRLVSPSDLVTAFPCGIELNNYLGTIPLPGDIQIYSPNLNTLAVVFRIYPTNQDMAGWNMDNFTVRSSFLAIPTNLV